MHLMIKNLRSLKTNTPHDNSDDRAPNFEKRFEVHSSLPAVYDKCGQLVTSVTLPTVNGLSISDFGEKRRSMLWL